MKPGTSRLARATKVLEESGPKRRPLDGFSVDGTPNIRVGYELILMVRKRASFADGGWVQPRCAV
jgi:hypothetical protein